MGRTQVISRVGSWLAAAGILAAAVVPAAQADYSVHPQGKAFIEEMVQKHQFDGDELRQLLRQAKRQETILEAIARPAERVLTWKDYSKIFLTADRIENGRRFLEQHRETLLRAEATYGVPPEIIVAILGVETKYGRIQGRHRVIDALTTLGFDYPPRSRFFRSELEQYLLMTREQGFDPLVLTGSYAGAMGYGQFIPSSFRRYAVDFDGDRVADIWNNPVDAIGSVANYFKEKGWKAGEPVAIPVQVEGSGYRQMLQKDLKPTRTLAELKRAGVQLPAETSYDDRQAGLLMELEGSEGLEHWVGFHNFYVITRYNISHLYALAVYQLSRELLNDVPSS